jgi:DNA repair protein RadC
MEHPELFNWKKPPPPEHPQEWKLVSLRECPVPEDLRYCDQPQKAADYWRLHVEGHPFFDSQRECFVVIVLNSKLRARGHYFVAVGTLNECMAHPRDVFRVAIVSAAYAICVMHNHPSGEPEPSQADITITRRLAEVGKIVGITLIDHVIVGHQRHCSLRELGLL